MSPIYLVQNCTPTTKWSLLEMERQSTERSSFLFIHPHPKKHKELISHNTYPWFIAVMPHLVTLQWTNSNNMKKECWDGTGWPISGLDLWPGSLSATIFTFILIQLMNQLVSFWLKVTSSPAKKRNNYYINKNLSYQGTMQHSFKWTMLLTG